MNTLHFQPERASERVAHVAGGCALPEGCEWPKDGNGKPLLHVMTLPAAWVEPGSAGWLSLFTPYYQADTYLHWEELTTEGCNESVVLFHDNDGVLRNEYGDLSPARGLSLGEGAAVERYGSRVNGAVAWLQDSESVPGSRCRMMINGDELDVGFSEEPGIFSDGVLYVFLSDAFQLASRPSRQGVLTFQFS
ncbi:hypothetical protein [Pseudomonas sp. NPDC089401]|uniref:hypothetical protein n=1 Tax=Pseudomonas sp. NPDC089401 TaxID=3364462 RepID=UPI0038235EFC